MRAIGLLALVIGITAGCGSGSSTPEPSLPNGNGDGTPPAVTPPVVTPPVETPPLVTPPVVTPPAPGGVTSTLITPLVVKVGDSAMLAATSGQGSPGVTYQWLLNGYAISGATSANYAVPTVKCMDSAKVFRSLMTTSTGSSLGDSFVLHPAGCPISLVAGIYDPPFDQEIPLDGVFDSPWALAPGPNGAMLAAGYRSIQSVSANGSSEKVVGFDTPCCGNTAYGVAMDAGGNLFAIDRRRIRKITPSGVVTTIAGSNDDRVPSQVDGPGAVARFQSPRGIALDKTGNLYVSDETTLRKMSTDGTVITLAGQSQAPGSSDGRGAQARFTALRGLAVDAAGVIFAVDETGNIRRVSPDGVVSTLAGTAGQRGLVDGQGAAARFYVPQGIAIDASGNLLVADGANSRVRSVTPSGMVTTLPFVFALPKSIDWVVNQDTPVFVSGIAIDASQTIWVSAPFAGSVFRVVNGIGPQVVAGAREPEGLGIVDGLAGKARFGDSVKGMVASPDGTLYVADSSTVRSVDRNGIVRTIAGLANATDAVVDGKGNDARFGNLWALVTDPSGGLLALDGLFLRKVAPDGTVTTLRSYSWLGAMNAAAMDADGTLFFAAGCELWSASPTGTLSHILGSFDYCVSYPALQRDPTPIERIAVSPDGSLFVFSLTRLSHMTKAGANLATWGDLFPSESARPPIAFDSRARAYVASSAGVMRISASDVRELVLPWPEYADTQSAVHFCYSEFTGFRGPADWAFDRDDTLFSLCLRRLYRIEVPTP